PVKFRGKKPIAGEDWHLLRIDHANVGQYFNGHEQNIGVQMGPASGGLKDVDLDCPEALALGPVILPVTDAVFGRKSAPAAHWLYITAALAVGGFLARAGFSPEEVRALVGAITDYKNPDRANDLPRTAEDAATQHHEGKQAYGLPKLIGVFGEAVAKRVAEWLA